ncbi:MAG TPA: flagellar hook-length control protein FliK [Sphingomonas sp.]
MRDSRPVAIDTAMTAPAAPVEARAPHAAETAAPPIDLRQERWPSAMIERIERMRDDVDAADTRVRLVPDALGAIEVDVRQDGDTLHVRFTAEQSATRALLEEAAPRLAEAADARGLKLGQTAVGADGAGGDRRQPPQPQSANPARPRAASASSDAHGSADHRTA